MTRLLTARPLPRRALFLLFPLLLGVLLTANISSADAPLSLNAGWQLQDAAKVAADGPRISTLGYQPGGWYQATVSGTVLTSLVNDGVYPEPLYGKDKALVKEFPGIAPGANGQIVIALTSGSADQPKISGIELRNPQ